MKRIHDREDEKTCCAAAIEPLILASNEIVLHRNDRIFKMRHLLLLLLTLVPVFSARSQFFPGYESFGTGMCLGIA